MPNARNTDPYESHLAAASVENTTETQARILALLRHHGPASDTELQALWNQYWVNDGWPAISPSGLRSRRKELQERGLVEDTGTRTLTPSGRVCAVWQETGRLF